MAPVKRRRLILLALMVSAVSGTSHDPSAPSKGYVYGPPAPVNAEVAALPLPPLTALPPALRSSQATHPHGFSYTYAVNHPNVESSSHVELTRFSVGRALPVGSYYSPSLQPTGRLPVVAIDQLALPPPSSFPAYSPGQTFIGQGAQGPLPVLQPNIRSEIGAGYSYPIGPGAQAAAPWVVTTATSYDPLQVASPALRAALPFASYIYSN
ncbi:Lysine-specific demethylase 3A [Frankliniella fusca]|uniref:Lysine-specific demethylase 3A n=1 Tax=Frankliniella fusca TaxID=407009 RepID=A0AAE1HU93_9NEOP|nr:Lysine-specific demethylase 3A [Frankliniella fusca]